MLSKAASRVSAARTCLCPRDSRTFQQWQRSSSTKKWQIDVTCRGLHAFGGASVFVCDRVDTAHTQLRRTEEPFYQQVRWKRHDGASALDRKKPRRQSKAQRRRFLRKLEREKEQAKHSAPGSKAGKRREWVRTQDQELLEQYDRNGHVDNHPSLAQYGVEDALFEDLMGNTAELTSQSTPEPIYYGHRQEEYFNRVTSQMEQYRQTLLSADSPSPALLAESLPQDKQVSLALRAYRDRHGTRNRPIGIAMALKHVLQDMRVPTFAFGEYTYTTLLTCCRTPNEARRIFQMMNEHKVPVSDYSWSILVDVHAKVGDFEGCAQVMKELVAEGRSPTLPAYTSLLASCYKVCNDGRVAHAIRSKAGEIGWDKWQEMRMVGLDPDVMAYGAILRICAARGHAERSLNILQEMQQFGVDPTTLCFTSALRAVAKSHETAIRYERGFSKKNKRRERITAHHGKMARAIVIMAENSHVELDDGFTSALILCAGAAGDVATAKAIYLASKVRKIDELRTIGSNEHLRLLRGEDAGQASDLEGVSQPLQLTHGSTAKGTEVEVANAAVDRGHLSYAEREYGRDSRIYSALLRACAAAVDQSGIGTMWEGRENGGYLCEASLRLINARVQPQYRNTDIPGLTRQEAGMGALVSYEDLQPPRKETRTRKKYRGVFIDDEVGTNLDNLPPQYHSMYFDKDNILREEYRQSSKYPEYDHVAQLREEERKKQVELLSAPASSETKQLSTSSTRKVDVEEMYFDYDTMSWKTGVKVEADASDAKRSQSENSSQAKSATSVVSTGSASQVEEMYFDYDLMKWATRPKVQSDAADFNYEQKASSNSKATNKDKLSPSDEELYFDDEIMRWRTKERTPEPTMANGGSSPSVMSVATARGSQKPHAEAEMGIPRKNGSMVSAKMPSHNFGDTESWKTISQTASAIDEHLREDVHDSGEIYFDDEVMRWRTRLSSPENSSKLEKVDMIGEQVASLENEGDTFGDDVEFEKFVRQLKEAVSASGEDIKFTETEARQLFQSMNAEDRDSERSGGVSIENHSIVHEDNSKNLMSDGKLPVTSRTSREKQSFNEMKEELLIDWDVDDWGDEENEQWDEDEEVGDIQAQPPVSIFDDKTQPTQSSRRVHTQVLERYPYIENHHDESSLNSVAVTSESNELVAENEDRWLAGEFNDDDEFTLTEEELEIKALAKALPGLPLHRLLKVREVFLDNLNEPSLLTLVPVLREHMPDILSLNTLRVMNAENTEYIMKLIEEKGMTDKSTINGVMQVLTSAGNLDKALAAHQKLFERHNLTPNGYSDRLVLQMFLKNKRLSRALTFKRSVEDSGRKLDLLAYGSLIDYCSRRKQMGSAMLFLDECLQVHGAAPSERYLKQLRLLGRQHGLEKEVALKAGDDPVAWLRHGEAHHKREKSKRGNRNILLAKNRAISL